ncbi:unnamed protein product [Amoebophrya sp. A25]|nr:unnamed protein product [Amoebophrya sp. A25]|eukprot:GSA25T00008813001.1
MGKDSGVIKGRLKLKGEPLQDKSKKKKKEKHGGSSASSKGSSSSIVANALPQAAASSSSSSAIAMAASTSAIEAKDEEGESKLLPQSRLTESQKSFLIAQEKRAAEKIEKSVKLTHQEKVARYNRHLSALSEHFDIPRVGPG